MGMVTFEGKQVMERPILFSGEMVRALLAGLKSQTMRVVRPQPEWVADFGMPFKTQDANPRGIINCPYGKPGDLLWVRETCRAEELPDGWDGVRYRADKQFIPIDNTPEAAERWGRLATNDAARWRPSIHMPRWASRVLLRVTAVDVIRLKSVTEEDVRREGLREDAIEGWCQLRLARLWDKINGERQGCAWEDNPWCWRIRFEVAHRRVR